MSLPTTRIYYYMMKSGAIEQYMSDKPEQVMVSNLTKIGKGELFPVDIKLPNDIISFFFPSGRIWYSNGSHFIVGSALRFRECMMIHKRQQLILDSRKKKDKKKDKKKGTWDVLNNKV